VQRQAGAQQRAAAGRQRQRQAAARRTFTPIPHLQPAPTQRAAHAAGKRAEAAERRSRGGSIPLPALPKMRYTPQQRAAAIALVSRAQQNALRHGETPESIARARKYDPKVRDLFRRVRALQGHSTRDAYAGLADKTLPKLRMPVGTYQMGGGLRWEGTELRPVSQVIGKRHAGSLGAAISAGMQGQVKEGKHSYSMKLGWGPATIRFDQTRNRQLLNAVFGNASQGQGQTLFHHRRFFGNAANDLISFAPNMVKGSYQLAMAARAAAPTSIPFVSQTKHKADPTELRRIADGFTRGALGELIVHGDPKAAAKAFVDHPLYSVLDVTGAYGAVGRLAGAGARLGGELGVARLRKIGDTARRDLHVDMANGVEYLPTSQSYSKNLLTSAMQHALESRRARNGGDAFRMRQSRLRDIASSVSGGAVRPGALGRILQEVDHTASSAEGIRRLNRDLLRNDVREIAGRVGVSNHEGILWAAVERRLDVSSPAKLRASLEHEVSRLERVHDLEERSMSPQARAYNRQEVKALRQALNDDRFLEHPERFAQAVDELSQRAQAITEDLVRRKVITAEQAIAATERPRAISLGAEFDHGASPYSAAVARHLEAKDRLKAATEKHREAERRHENAREEAGRLKGKAQAARAALKAELESRGGLVTAEQHVALEDEIARLRGARSEAHGQDREALGRRIAQLQTRRRELRQAGALDSRAADAIGAEVRRVHKLEADAKAAQENVRATRATRRNAKKVKQRAGLEARETHPKRYVTGLVRGDAKMQAALDAKAAADHAHELRLEARAAKREATLAAKEGRAPNLGPRGSVVSRSDLEVRLDELRAQQADVNYRVVDHRTRQDAAVAEHGMGSPPVRALSDEGMQLFAEGNRIAQSIDALKAQLAATHTGELITGAPDVAVHDLTWYHGTDAAFEGLPSAKGSWNDLGVYMTSDPGYAAQYATRGQRAPVAGDVEGARTVLSRVDVDPRRVLDMRRGYANPTQLAEVLEHLLVLGRKVTRTPKASKTWAKGKGAPGWGNMGEPPRPTSAISPLTEKGLEAHAKQLRSGKEPSLEDWRNMDMAMREASRSIAEYIGKGGTGRYHQPLNRMLRGMGYDVVRKVDQHADSIVVLNEKVLKAPLSDYARVAKDVEEAGVRADHARAIADQATRLADKARRRAQLTDDRISTDQLVQEREAAGVPAGGFLTHKPGAQGARAFFVQWFGGRKTAGKYRRTGETTRVGGVDTSIENLEAAMAYSQGVADAAGNFDNFIGRLGAVHPDGTPYTPEEAIRVAAEHNENADPELHVTPVNMAPASYSAEHAAEIISAQNAGRRDFLKGIVDRQMADAVDSLHFPENAGKPIVALVPTQALKRFTRHQLVGSSEAGKFFSKLTSAFRKTVLPFSPKWITGNVAEALMRSVINGVIPGRDQQIGLRLLKRMEELDPEAAKRFREQALGGLLFGTSDNMSVYRDRTMFEGTGLNAVGEFAGDIHDAVLGKPITLQSAAYNPVHVARAGAKGIGLAQRGIFAANKGIERAFQAGVLGKLARREMQELTGSWTKALRSQGAAFDDLARGMMHTHNQVRFARDMDTILGKYSRFSPTTRRLTQNLLPFLPWYLNSIRFVFHTLPVGHPVLTAVLANTERVYQEDWDRELKAMGRYGKTDLAFAIRRHDGGFVNLARFFPPGAFTSYHEETILGPLVDSFLPQLASSFGILKYGKNFAGHDLQLSSGGKAMDDPWLRMALAAYSAFEAFMPLAQITRRLEERGQTGYDDSTFWAPRSKKGTAYRGAGKAPKPGIGAAARRVFDPFRPIYTNAPIGGVTSDSRAAPASKDPVQRAIDHVAQGQANGPGILSDPAVQKALEGYRPPAAP
jgi:hypothetical protein